MAEVLQIPNYDDINILEEALLDGDAALGQAIFTLLDTQNIAGSDRVLLGRKGSETGEIVTVSSLTGKNVTATTNLLNNHKKYEPVYKLYGDTIRVYRALNVDGNIPDDSQFSLIGSVAIDPDQPYTLYSDGTGGSGYWYKTSYFSSVTSNETALNQSVAQRGGGYGHYVSVESIRHEAGLNNNTAIDDTQISERRDQAESRIKGALMAAGYTLPLKSENGVEYTPPDIENIARVLGAGLVLDQEYGITAPSLKKEGGTKVKFAMEMLQDIRSGRIVLIDPTGNQLAKASLVAGWPDDTTASQGTDGVSPEPIQVRMSDRF